MSTEIREIGSPQAPRPSSPSRESTFSGLIDPAAAKMRILVAPYYSPYVVSIEKVQSWEGLILMLQRLFGPNFCSISTPPKITLHRTEELITSDNWPNIVSADCCIVVHTRSEETGALDTSPRPTTSGSLGGKGKLAPIKATNNTTISSPAATPRDPRARLINRHANSGFETPNLFDSGNFTTGSPEEPTKKKRKRKGSWWDSLLTMISGAVHLSSSSRQNSQNSQAQPLRRMGTVTHIVAMEPNTSKKLRQSRRVKGKRVSRVIVQTNNGAGRPVSIARTPVKTRFGSTAIIGGPRKRSAKNKRRSIPPPLQSQKPVRRHMGRSHSDCSSCFCDDDDKRDSIVIAARQVGGGKQPIVLTAVAPSSPSSGGSSQLKDIDIGSTMLSRSEKADSFTIFTSPIIEEFSLQPKKKARPPSSAAATKTSSVYYESTPPPIPKRSEEDETGFHAQFKLCDEKTVRNLAKQAIAVKKAEESLKKAETRPHSSRHSHSSRTSTTATPKRSNSMGHAINSSPTPGKLRRSGTTNPSTQSTPSKSSATKITVDPHYKEKHTSTSSKAGTVNSAGSRSSSSMGFRRQSTPFDNKPLPKLPVDHSNTSSIDMKHPSVSPTGVIVMPPIATFEDLLSKTTASSIAEVAEGAGSVKDVTMIAGQA